MTKQLMIKTAISIGLLFSVGCSNLPQSLSDLTPETQTQIQKLLASVSKVSEEGGTAIDHDTLQKAIVDLPKGDLSDAEKAGLVLMREEEKLAFDVYTKLGEKWDDRRFQNISKSESTHTEAVKVLLVKYGLDDPNATHTAGKYENQTLQKVYDDFIAKGETSLVDALKVGAEVEDLDIADLKRLLAETKLEDLKVVYEQLMRGSRNHLRAFVKGLTANDATYTASHLSQSEFDAIAAGSVERGPLANGDGKGKGPGGQGQGNGPGGGGQGQGNGPGGGGQGQGNGPGGGGQGPGNGLAAQN